MTNRITYKDLETYFESLEELHKLIHSSQQIAAYDTFYDSPVDHHFAREAFEEKNELIISTLNTLSDDDYKRLFDHFINGDSSYILDIINRLELVEAEWN